MAVFLIYLLFTIAFFGNFFVKNYFLPPHITLLTEAIIYFLFLYSLIASKLRLSRFHWHLCYTLLLILLISICSIAINHYYNLKFIFSLRIFWRFFIFYLVIINFGFEETDFKKINIFISALLILQLPIVALQFNMHGIAEKNFGSFFEGGAVTTMYPITAVMYLAGYFAFFKARLIYPLLGAGFIAWSIVGMKRAVFLLYPLTFFGMYYLIYIKGMGRSLRLAKKIFYPSLIIVFIVTVSFFILKYNRTLNPEKAVGGSVDLEYAFKYHKKYTTRADYYNPSITTGRFSTFVNTFGTLKDAGFGTFLFGFGPGAFTKSIFGNVDARLTKFELGYGITPLTYVALECGILGVIVYLIIIVTYLRMCWKYYFFETDSYWRAFAVGSLGLAFFMVFLFCAYNHNSYVGDNFPLLYFYIMGVIFVRLKTA